MRPRDSHHLYVHVPFCRLVCAYCDFVTVGGRRNEIPRYVDALVAELGRREAPGRLETIYLGGGTPSLLPADAVRRLVDSAVERWGDEPLEVTLEANPSARERPAWAGLRGAGVNRISLGVQSLHDEDLALLARGHTVDEARDAYAEVRDAGFDNVSIDLIFGIPGQSVARWRKVLAAAVAMAPDHLSLYGLQLALAPDEWAAPPRSGALRWRRRLADRQDDAVAAAQYRLAEEVLGAAGYEHYELSSWARPGRQSLHNAAYWARRPYTGIGAGAHSYDGAARRWWNTRDLDDYLARTEAGMPATEGGEELDRAAREFEAMALGLRTIAGVDRAAFAGEMGFDPVERWPALQVSAARRLVEIGRRVRLSAEGRLLANEVLLGLLPDDAGAAPRAQASVR